MTSKLTVTELLKNKERYEVKQQATETVHIERLGADVIIQKPERSLCLEALQMSRSEQDADVFLVYNTLIEPNLKDAQLQHAFGCVEPTDIVGKLFESGEIGQLAELALELAGYKRGAAVVVKDLKN